MLAQEPWRYTPDQIAKLTDWQIEYLYALPAAKRADELRKEMPAAPGSPAPAGKKPGQVEESDLGEPGSPTHRNWHLAAYVNGPLRIDPKKAIALYEKQLAQWKAEQGK